MIYTRVKPKKFIETKEQMPKKLALFLTDYSEEDYKAMSATCYLSSDNRSGYTIKPDSDLISVFSLPGAHLGKQAVESAITNGATKLDCIDVEFLVKLYNKLGFVEYKRGTWDDAYAPRDWDYKRFGRPDIVYMKLM